MLEIKEILNTCNLSVPEAAYTEITRIYFLLFLNEVLYNLCGF